MCTTPHCTQQKHQKKNRYSEPEIALNCGSILREVIRHEPLNDLLLNSPLFDAFFEYVQLSTFDVASDAFATFKVCYCYYALRVRVLCLSCVFVLQLMLTKHKVLCAKFLEHNFDKVPIRVLPCARALIVYCVLCRFLASTTCCCNRETTLQNDSH